MSDGKMHTGQPWEPPETELLIHLYAKRRDEFKKKGMKKKLIFEEIAKKIPKRNATACQKKMEQLLRDYRRRLQCHSTTDAKEDPKIVKNLEPYFDLLNRVENGDCLPELQLSGKYLDQWFLTFYFFWFLFKNCQHTCSPSQKEFLVCM